MNWKILSINNSSLHKIKVSVFFLLFLSSFFLYSCASMDNYIPGIEIGASTSSKKENLLKSSGPLKETNLIFSPIISLKDFNKEGIQKNKFFLAGEIYSKKPEEQVSSLSSDNCYFPREQNSANKLQRLYHVFIKDLGLISVNANELAEKENIDSHFLIQPVLLKYQYCRRAEVEIRYIIQNASGTLATKTIKTFHRAKNFKFPEKDETHPFINHNDPGAQFPNLRNALTMAFYKNTLDLIETISEEFKGYETK
jgi:hypothetical protein